MYELCSWHVSIQHWLIGLLHLHRDFIFGFWFQQLYHLRRRHLSNQHWFVRLLELRSWKLLRFGCDRMCWLFIRLFSERHRRVSLYKLCCGILLVQFRLVFVKLFVVLVGNVFCNRRKCLYQLFDWILSVHHWSNELLNMLFWDVFFWGCH